MAKQTGILVCLATAMISLSSKVRQILSKSSRLLLRTLTYIVEIGTKSYGYFFVMTVIVKKLKT